ncbi:MAG: diversity-generating retroelement protein Avd [Rhodoferax sp.]|uniref:diversity-generating retroelement protein Avd n=1 Tax=Rhodoferax sp. TaxID=50421 RepID=UPI00260E03FF|nr:diversity-generating retroelement protein Avd [Rhodoferax sp.]MDD2882851.1 diversity-generating retroelement protein Avd [Rhodoferax sp.]
MPNAPDRSRSTGPALEKWYQFLRWLTPVLEKFPRSHKFTLGERIYTGTLDVLDRLIEATYSRHATPMLLQANMGLEKLRFMFRLAVDLQLLDLHRYEFAARAVDEVGRLVGGWIKVKGGPDAQTAR